VEAWKNFRVEPDLVGFSSAAFQSNAADDIVVARDWARTIAAATKKAARARSAAFSIKRSALSVSLFSRLNSLCRRAARWF
jgi:hypothetical protein